MASGKPVRVALKVGRALARAGENAKAVLALEQALAGDPQDGEAHWLLAGALARLGREAAAAGHYRAAGEAGFEPAGARFMRAAVGDGAPPAHAPPQFMRRFFDAYAPTFDAHLTGTLAYHAPAQVAARVRRLCGARARPAILDLGCGTGLAGAALKACAGRLEGIDIAPLMLAEAAKRGIYDALHEGDLAPALRGFLGRAFDVAIAADVLVYFGDLEDVLAAVAAVVRAGGFLVFTVEHFEAARGWRLGASGRYAHSRPYLRAAAGPAGWRVRAIEETVLRREGDAPVHGLLASFERRPG